MYSSLNYLSLPASYAVVGGSLLLWSHSSSGLSASALAQGSFACMSLLSAYSSVVDCATHLAEACGAAQRVLEVMTLQESQRAEKNDTKAERWSPSRLEKDGLEMYSKCTPIPVKEPLLTMDTTSLYPTYHHEFKRPARYLPACGPATLLRVQDLTLRGPGCKLLLHRLSFELKAGMRVLIRGPSGCGKSSLLRLLAGIELLWREKPSSSTPTVSGSIAVYCPPEGLVCAPQQPYLFRGTLRDNLFFPTTTLSNTIPTASTDKGHVEACRQALVDVGLEPFLDYLEEESEEEAVVRDWCQVASFGEQQRIAAARLILRRPVVVGNSTPPTEASLTLRLRHC